MERCCTQKLKQMGPRTIEFDSLSASSSHYTMSSCKIFEHSDLPPDRERWGRNMHSLFRDRWKEASHGRKHPNSKLLLIWQIPRAHWLCTKIPSDCKILTISLLFGFVWTTSWRIRIPTSKGVYVHRPWEMGHGHPLANVENLSNMPWTCTNWKT